MAKENAKREAHVATPTAVRVPAPGRRLSGAAVPCGVTSVHVGNNRSPATWPGLLRDDLAHNGPEGDPIATRGPVQCTPEREARHDR